MELGSAAPSDTSVARILGAQGRPEGAGFLTTHREVITCAHVVARALGAPLDATEAPAGRLWVDFPLAEGGRPVEAVIRSWTPIGADGSGDIAVLRLLADAPAKAAVARLVEHVAEPDRKVRTFGFPPDYDDGVWSVGRLRGRTGAGWLQYDTDPASEHRVRKGFSGAPVWDVTEGGVVGMVVAADGRRDVRTAYLIPTETLRETWSDLAEAARPACPFRSLEPFEERDALLFHGREEPARRIVDRLGYAPATSLVGPSGCGKSSLLYAGVLPRLRGRQDLEIVLFRPGQLGRTPLAALALALLPRLEPELTETARLAELPRLTQLLREGQMPAVVDRVLARQGKNRLLVVADQFEEALIGTEQAELDALADALGYVLRPGSRLQLATTLRSDFLTPALNHPGLAPLLGGDQLFTVGAMSDDELRAAVVRPLERTGVSYEAGLVDRILGDLGSDPGRLPLLEFTLTRLWENQDRRHRVMRHAAYESLGRVDEALVTHAQQVWESGLTREEHPAARALLVQLVHPGDGRTAPTRRTLARSELRPEQWRIAQRLMTTRLVVPGEEYRPADGPPEETVELAHETLLTRWDRLREYFETDRDFRVWQEDLRRRTAQWTRNERSAKRLVRGAELRDARAWRSRKESELAPVEAEFIEASVRGARRRRITLTALTLGLLLVMGTATWAWRDDNRTEAAEASRVLLQQSRDAEEATADGGARYTALLLALRAYRTQDNSRTRARIGEMHARYGFADLVAPRYATTASTLLTALGEVPGPSVADAGARVIAASAADGNVVVLRLDGSGVRRQPTEQKAEITAVSPDGSLVAMAESWSDLLSPPSTPSGPPDMGGRPVRLYDVRTQDVRRLERPEKGDPLPEVSAEVPGFPDLEMPDLPDIPGLTVPTQYARLAFTPDGGSLLGQTGLFGEDGWLILWDVAHGRIKKIMPGLPESVAALWPSAGGEHMLTLSEAIGGLSSSTITLTWWDLTGKTPTGQEVLSWESTTEHTVVVDVSPDLTRVAVAETYLNDLKVSHRLAVHKLPGGELVSQERTAQQEAVAGISVADEGSRVLAYGTLGLPASGTPADDGPITRLDSRWAVDLLGSGAELSALLSDSGVLAVVGSDDGDAVRRLPPPAAKAGGTPSAADAGRWTAGLCRILGDDTLPPAAAEKVPPGAYRGPVCSWGKDSVS
ncbi:trypsin-like peptidase domain-containing protein [Streptomyces sp. NPDC002018]|uniref:nSTAND1 domain-containing NTPase n=1 Tax=Streptomyces sp. NPDC002018 TaxID=3364629 RepID=UPI0036945D22